MSEWTRPAQPVRCPVYLSDPLTVRREQGVLVQGDENANAIVAEVYRQKGVPYDLTGATVTLTFVRPDNLAAPPITAEITGENHNIAIATLTDTCYRYSGVYAASLKLHTGNTERTILRLIGDIISTENSGTVDDEQLFPTPEELLETLEQVETARQSAEAAAARANTAAARAEQLAIDASGFAGDSNKLGGKPPEYYLPAVNLLDNPDFSIAQAGYGGMHGATKYAADRWQTIATTIEAPAGGKGIKISGGSWACKTVQHLADIPSMIGKTFTFSVKARGTAKMLYGVFEYDANGSEIARHEASEQLDETWRVMCVTLTLQNCATAYVRLDNVSDGNADFEIDWAALYEGAYTPDTVPTFAKPNPVLELAKCQYYAQIITVDTWAPLCIGTSLIDGYMDVILPIATMRPGNPDVVLPATGLYIDGTSNRPLNVTDATVPIIRNTGNYITMQIVDTHIATGNHSIATRGEKVSVLIDNNL